MRCKKRLAAEENWIKGAKVCGLAAARRSHLVGHAGLKRVDRYAYLAKPVESSWDEK